MTMEIQNGLKKGLVNTNASTSMIVVGIVQKLGIMHLILNNENYKTTFWHCHQNIEKDY
jgi:hypothetical protein